MDLSKVSKKDPHEDNRMTLTAIDTKTIEYYNNYYDTLPDKQKQLKQLVQKKNGFRAKYSTEYYNLCKKIENLELEIYDIKNKIHQTDYLLKAASHFLEYSNNTKCATKCVTNTKQEVKGAWSYTLKDGVNRAKICQDYVKECIGDGYSLSTKTNKP